MELNDYHRNPRWFRQEPLHFRLGYGKVTGTRCTAIQLEYVGSVLQVGECKVHIFLTIYHMRVSIYEDEQRSESVIVQMRLYVHILGVRRDCQMSSLP